MHGRSAGNRTSQACALPSDSTLRKRADVLATGEAVCNDHVYRATATIKVSKQCAAARRVFNQPEWRHAKRVTE